MRVAGRLSVALNNGVGVGDDKLECKVEVTGDCHWLEQLSVHSGLSRSQLKRAMTAGAVWLEEAKAQGERSRPRRLRRSDSKVRSGALVSLYYDAALLEQQPLTPVLIEDMRDFSVWDKPAGMRVSGSYWGDHLCLLRVVEKHLSGRATQLLHRLDSWTSGLILVAHNKKAASELAALFAERKVYKRYRAQVAGDPALTLPHVIDSPVDGKQALSRIVSVVRPQQWLNPEPCRALPEEFSNAVSEFCIEIETGRKHQIRSHLAALGLPVLGDRRFGFAQNAPEDDISGASLARADKSDESMAVRVAATNLQLRAVEIAFNYGDKAFRWCLDQQDEVLERDR